MFICTDKCINKYNNIGWMTSYGPCEICGVRKECYDIPSKHLERKVDSTSEEFTDNFGNHIINVHSADSCSGKCTIHSHSKHILSDKPLLWRNDRKIFEHICDCGIGHPCPDSLGPTDSGVHGCCGHCSQ